MHLNTLRPGAGKRKKKMRVGRGIGSGKGKTCGRGHKGQHSRSGGYHKVGFEGGQMPIQRRVPKFGFVSKKKLFSAEVRLDELNKVFGDAININTLKENGIINQRVKQVKIFASGKLQKSIVVTGLRATQSVKIAIEKAGGKVVDRNG
ncbi:50S ribosomal protein L15 [Coxiella endosymbiont of Amblyomma americanum]|uniref:50S ribosomal protein L15 n=1 Tax=Coxiella endosymbiont of Amblyomma americanum TaxID=325775 RepID=UPI00057F4FAB|nr:50S ribosomal protein L15 [Coxiella endosymbiont of Amblyomma americanum]AJC50442.1 50S ribosomal protein L15 [Coxiella endosymbiont of Amblyomma americanum]AUJ58782.1 50S ribosomal protein L15 [Coxiella-like endosymbiont of Amblyomma americanum]